MPGPQPYSNITIGKKIGMSHSGVCRLRMGNRFPSSEAARRIEEALNWPIVDQFNAIRNGTYAEEFEKVIRGE